MLVSQPVYLVEISEELRALYNNLPDHVKFSEIFTFLEGSEDPQDEAIGGDTFFIGIELFQINATDDGRFYLHTCRKEGFESFDEHFEAIRINQENKNDGITPPTIKTGEYGAYFDTATAALKTAIDWILTDPRQYPIEHRPPVIKEK